MIHSVIWQPFLCIANTLIYNSLQLPTIAVSRIRRHRNGFPSMPGFSVNRFVAPLV